MKIYTVFLFDADNPTQYSHVVGSFDSIENYQKALRDFEVENDILLTKDDYDVCETELNKNLVLLQI